MIKQIQHNVIQDRKRGWNTAISDRVLEAMARIPREDFVREDRREEAYRDGPVFIGHGKNASQPYIVAVMAALLDVHEHHRVLDIGTGLGYHAAVLAQLAGHVYTIERIRALGEEAVRRLPKAGITNAEVRIADGRSGWPEHAPFDRINIAAAPTQVPSALIEQLALGGRMVLPLGPRSDQHLVVVTKDLGGHVSRHTAMPVRFVQLDHGTLWASRQDHQRGPIRREPTGYSR